MRINKCVDGACLLSSTERIPIAVLLETVDRLEISGSVWRAYCGDVSFGMNKWGEYYCSYVLMTYSGESLVDAFYRMVDGLRHEYGNARIDMCSVVKVGVLFERIRLEHRARLGHRARCAVDRLNDATEKLSTVIESMEAW